MEAGGGTWLMAISIWIQPKQYRLQEILKVLSWKHHVQFRRDATSPVFSRDGVSQVGTCSAKTAAEATARSWPFWYGRAQQALRPGCMAHTQPSSPTPFLDSSFNFCPLLLPSPWCAQDGPSRNRVYSLYSAVLHLPWLQNALVSGWGSKRMEIISRCMNVKSALK